MLLVRVDDALVLQDSDHPLPCRLVLAGIAHRIGVLALQRAREEVLCAADRTGLAELGIEHLHAHALILGTRVLGEPAPRVGDLLRTGRELGRRTAVLDRSLVLGEVLAIGLARRLQRLAQKLRRLAFAALHRVVVPFHRFAERAELGRALEHVDGRIPDAAHLGDFAGTGRQARVAAVAECSTWNIAARRRYPRSFGWNWASGRCSFSACT